MSAPYAWCLLQPRQAHTNFSTLAICEQSIPWLPFIHWHFVCTFKENNGYKRQSGKNKIWCKAQISVPEDWVNWPGGLVKKPTQERRRALLLAHLSSMHVPMFNNFLQASWPLALVLLHRAKSWSPRQSQVCVVFLCFVEKSAWVDTWADVQYNSLCLHFSFFLQGESNIL